MADKSDGDDGNNKANGSGWKRRAAYVTIGAATFAIGTPLVLGAIGFGAGGIAAGSSATAIMASYGGVVAKGSICALLQSAGAAGVGTTGTVFTALLGGGVGGAAGVTGEKLVSKFWIKNPVKPKL